MYVAAQVINIWLWALSQPPQGVFSDNPESHRSKMSKRHLQPVCTPQLPAKASFNGCYSAETTMARHERWVSAQRYLLPDCTGSHLSGGMNRTLPGLFPCFLAAGDSRRCSLPVNRMSSCASPLWVSVSPFHKDKATLVANKSKLFFRTGWLFPT